MKRKVRKFSEGDVVEDFANDANDRVQSSANKGNPAKSESYAAEPDSFVGPKISDKEAFRRKFAQERAKGSKEFTWNGKRYTTELAGDKPATKSKGKEARSDEPSATPAKGSSSAPAKAASSSGKSDSSELGTLAGAAAAALLGGAAASRRTSSAPPDVNLRLDPSMSSRVGGGRAGVAPSGGSLLREMNPQKAYAKGGGVKSSASKRADGCAVRGKTKGKIY